MMGISTWIQLLVEKYRAAWSTAYWSYLGGEKGSIEESHTDQCLPPGGLEVGDGEGLLFPPAVVKGAELPPADDPPAEVGTLDVGRGWPPDGLVLAAGVGLVPPAVPEAGAFVGPIAIDV